MLNKIRIPCGEIIAKETELEQLAQYPPECMVYQLDVADGVLKKSRLILPKKYWDDNPLDIIARLYWEEFITLDISLPDYVTEIANNAFTDSEGVARLTIPDSVTRVGSDAFTGLTRLQSVQVYGVEILFSTLWEQPGYTDYASKYAEQFYSDYLEWGYRDNYNAIDNCSVNVEDYDSEEEYEEALDNALYEYSRNELEEQIQYEAVVKMMHEIALMINKEYDSIRFASEETMYDKYGGFWLPVEYAHRLIERMVHLYPNDNATRAFYEKINAMN